MTDHATKTTARLFDFLHRRTPWHRRLWGIGTVLGLQEVVEYSRLRREANLPPDGLKYVAVTMRREIAQDPGAAPFVKDLDQILERGDKIDANDASQTLISPLSLSARAEAELRLLGSDGASWIVDLLGR